MFITAVKRLYGPDDVIRYNRHFQKCKENDIRMIYGFYSIPLIFLVMGVPRLHLVIGASGMVSSSC